MGFHERVWPKKIVSGESNIKVICSCGQRGEFFERDGYLHRVKFFSNIGNGTTKVALSIHVHLSS